MEWYYLYPIIIVAGFCTGFINTLAGSGAAFSLIALNLVGFPVTLANGTVRVGILVNNLVAIFGYKKQGVFEGRKAAKLIFPAMLGAIFGVFAAVHVSVGDLRLIIGIAMLVIFVMLFLKPSAWLKGRQDKEIKFKPGCFQFIAYFLIGFYGGFIQMGVGVFLLTGLVLFSGIDILRANSIKVVIIFLYTIIALIVFSANGLVRWDIGLVMSIGNAGGAWLATKEAVKRGAGFVRWVLIIVVTLASLHYLGILRIIVNSLSNLFCFGYTF